MRYAKIGFGGFALFAVVAIAGWALGRWLMSSLAADAAAFDAGYVATVVGIAVGVPAAVGLSLGLRRVDQDWTQRIENGRYLDLLKTIDDDLADALEELQREGPGERQPRDAPVAPFLGSGLWETLRSSGQVERIRDPFLLRVIARAYDRIATTGYLERLAWELSMNPSVRTLMNRPGTLGMVEEAMAYVASQDHHTKAAVDHARESIAFELVESASTGIPSTPRRPDLTRHQDFPARGDR